MNGDIQLQCPYDKSHQIRQSRMVFHLRKCAKNHPNSKKKVCIYDVCHVLDPEDYEDHINSCPAKEAVIQYEKPSLEPEPGLPITISNVANNWPQDTTDWPQDAADWPQDTADWPQDEADQAQNNSAAFVSPLHNINNQLVSRTLIGASKSVKKQFILEQRQKFQQAQRDDEKNDKGNDSHATPAATAKQSMKNDTNTSIQPKSNIKSDSKLKNGSINNPVNVKLNENSVTQNASSVAVKPVTLSVAESVTQNVSTKSVTDTLAQPSHNTGAIPKKPFNYAAALHKKTSIEKPSLLENISSNKSVNKAIVCNDNTTVKVYNEKENISNNSIITSTVKGSIITNEIEDVENFSIKEDDFQEVKRKSHKKTNKQQEKSTTKVDNKEVNTTGKKPSRYAGTNQGNKQNSAAGHGGGRRK